MIELNGRIVMAKDRARKQKLAAVRSELKQLENTPAHFDQLERARRCEQANILNRKAHCMFGDTIGGISPVSRSQRSQVRAMVISGFVFW